MINIRIMLLKMLRFPRIIQLLHKGFFMDEMAVCIIGKSMKNVVKYRLPLAFLHGSGEGDEFGVADDLEGRPVDALCFAIAPAGATKPWP